MTNIITNPLTKGEPCSSRPRWRVRRPAVLIWLGLLLTAAGAVAAWGLVRFGSCEAAFEILGGRRIILVPSRVAVAIDPHSPPEREVRQSFRVYNCSDQPVRLLGAASGCPCAAATGFPLVVDPGESTSFPVVIKKKALRVGRTGITVWTDRDGEAALTASLLFFADPTDAARAL